MKTLINLRRFYRRIIYFLMLYFFILSIIRLIKSVNFNEQILFFCLSLLFGILFIISFLIYLKDNEKDKEIKRRDDYLIKIFSTPRTSKTIDIKEKSLLLYWYGFSGKIEKSDLIKKKFYITIKVNCSTDNIRLEITEQVRKKFPEIFNQIELKFEEIEKRYKELEKKEEDQFFQKIFKKKES